MKHLKFLAKDESNIYFLDLILKILHLMHLLLFLYVLSTIRLNRNDRGNKMPL